MRRAFAATCAHVSRVPIDMRGIVTHGGSFSLPLQTPPSSRVPLRPPDAWIMALEQEVVGFSG